MAIQSAASFIGQKLAQPELGLSEELAVECAMFVRGQIYEHAARKKHSARDYACTFLGLLSSPFCTLAMQIGDGGIVLDVGSGLEVAIQPMSGEYANMTNFVTEEDAIGILQCKLYPNSARKVAVFSDGLQRLALNMATNQPHEPFFAPFFSALSTATLAQEDQLHAALVSFLESDRVNERTDDDKSLALAILI